MDFSHQKVMFRLAVLNNWLFIRPDRGLAVVRWSPRTSINTHPTYAQTSHYKMHVAVAVCVREICDRGLDQTCFADTCPSSAACNLVEKQPHPSIWHV